MNEHVGERGEGHTPVSELVDRVRYVENIAYAYDRLELAAALHRFANDLERRAGRKRR